MLYLLKASRVREYHKENLAILCAEEHEPFSVTYSRRWVQPGLSIAAGTGAAIVFADSPYETYVPIRFAKIDHVEETDQRITVTGTLGPLICTDDPSALERAWLPRGNDRPGKTWFLFEDDNHGMLGPRGLDDPDRSWERIAAALPANSFFARSTIARITRLLDADGLELDAGDGVEVGAVVTVELDVHTPGGDGDPSVQVSVDPAGALEPVGEAEQVGASTVRVPMRVLAPGELLARLSFRPEPLLSCRPVVALTAHPSAREQRPPIASASDADRATLDLRSLVRFLTRDASLSDALWVELLDDHLLAAAPNDPFLLETYATHAAAAGLHERAFEALLHIEERSPAAEEALLCAALRVGDGAVVGDAVVSTDISDDATFARILAAAAEAPPAATHVLLERVLGAELLGDAKLTDLVTTVAPSITSVEVMCKAAERIAYVEPSSASTMLLERWPDPESMPPEVLDLLVGWEVERDRTAPFVRHRIEHADHDGDVAALRSLADQVRRRGAGRTRAELLAAVGLPLLLADDPRDADVGFEVLEQAARELAASGDIDHAIGVLRQLEVHERLWRSNDRQQALDELREAVGNAIDADDRFVAWQRFQDATAYDALKPKLTNKTLHLVGGWEQPWAAELERGLGVANLLWHESRKDRSANTDWADGLDGQDVVVVLTDFIGHDTSTPLKDKVRRKGATHVSAKMSKRKVLEGLEQVLLRGEP